MSIEIVRLFAQDILSVQSQIVEIYRQAFGGPPYNKDDNEVRGFTNVFPRHISRDGFRCIAARDERTGLLAGFAYGYTGMDGQWWHDFVVRTMEPVMVEEWMTDVFEVVEVAVLPSMQGKGIGSRIHDALLADLPHRTAALSTYQEETVALKLYEKRGWITLLHNFIFPGYAEPYRIMGKLLKPV